MSTGVFSFSGWPAGGIRKQQSGARNASTTRVTLSSAAPLIATMSANGRGRRIARPRRSCSEIALNIRSAMSRCSSLASFSNTSSAWRDIALPMPPVAS